MNPFQTLKSNFSKIFNPPKKTVTPSVPSFATPTTPTIGPMPFIGPRQPTPTAPSITPTGGGFTSPTISPRAQPLTNNFSTDNAYREAYKVQQKELQKLFNDAGIPEIIDPVKQPELVRQKHEFLSQYGWGMDKTGKTYSLSDQGRSA